MQQPLQQQQEHPAQQQEREQQQASTHTAYPGFSTALTGKSVSINPEAKRKAAAMFEGLSGEEEPTQPKQQQQGQHNPPAQQEEQQQQQQQQASTHTAYAGFSTALTGTSMSINPEAKRKAAAIFEGLSGEEEPTQPPQRLLQSSGQQRGAAERCNETHARDRDNSNDKPPLTSSNPPDMLYAIPAHPTPAAASLQPMGFTQPPAAGRGGCNAAPDVPALAGHSPLLRTPVAAAAAAAAAAPTVPASDGNAASGRTGGGSSVPNITKRWGFDV